MVGQIQKDGSVYINTRKPENPIRTKVGSAELPPGINLALQTMKVDEIATLTCKPQYGYGSDGQFAFSFISLAENEFKV
jgi:FKBP-type peptidyl-prolyl cis-trans isomerase